MGRRGARVGGETGLKYEGLKRDALHCCIIVQSKSREEWVMGDYGFYIFYVVAIIILILHFTGWLKRNNLEWIVLVLAVATFPAVIFLR